MNTNKKLLIALTSVALFWAAPLEAQRPQPASAYALQVTADNQQLQIYGGVPGFPVGLAAGINEIRVMFPGEAILRVEPLVIFTLGNFDANGEFRLPLNITKGPPVGPYRFFLQPFSVVGDLSKFCTAELLHLETDFHTQWIWNPAG